MFMGEEDFFLKNPTMPPKSGKVKKQGVTFDDSTIIEK